MQVRMRKAPVVPAVVAVCAMAMVGTVAACSKDSSSGTGGDGDDAVVSVGIAEPKHLFGENAGDTPSGQVVYSIFAGLLDYDKDAKPVNVIADSVTTNDSKVWTIKLKDGFTFHNGEKVTADSFINAWNWGAYAPNRSDVNSYYAQIDGYAELNPSDGSIPAARAMRGLARVDDLTFTVTLADPFADFATVLGYTAFYPLPAAAFGPDGSITKAFEDAPIGNGPFKIKGKWNHDVSIETERFDGWKGTKPKVAGITYKIYQDLKAQYADALANTLDVDPSVDSANLTNAGKDFGDRYRNSPASTFQYLAFPTYDPKFAKVEVRRAISMAIDRDQIVKTIFAGTQKSARSFMSPILPGYRDDTCGEACRYNPTDARRLYAQAGGPDAIQITYNADGGHKEWVEATCNQLHDNLGIACTAKPEPKFADMLTKLRAKDPAVGMFRLAWSMDYPSMYDYLFPQYDTASIPAPNYFGYSNPQFDALVKQGATAKTSQEAIKFWQQAEDILARDLPVLPLRFGKNNYVVSTRIKHVDVNLFTWVDPYTLQAA